LATRNEKLNLIGLEIGGANIKAALLITKNGNVIKKKTVLQYFPIWKRGKEQLPEILDEIKKRLTDSFELNVVDYILKPFSFDRLVKAVNKISELQPGPSTVKQATAETATRFFVKGDKKHHQIDLNDLLYIEAYGNYTKIFLKDEMIMSHEKISDFEALLPQESFLRVHKSFIVAIDKIKLIEGNRIFIESHKIPIGQTYKSSVKRLFNI